MRHYYDVYCLLQTEEVLSFIGTPEYQVHKQKRFRRADNPVITANEAFRLNDAGTRQAYETAYQDTRALYYKDQPEFSEILRRIEVYADRL